MIHHRLPVIAWICAWICASLAACNKPERPHPGGPGVSAVALAKKVTDVPTVETNADSLLSAEQRGVVLADLGGGHRITLGDLEKRLESEPEVVRQQYSTVAKRREYLLNWVQLEVLADEARRQGLDKDPRVVEALKRQMVRRYLKEAVIDRVRAGDITDAEIQAYYDHNQPMYHRPEQVEVRQMLFSSEAKARQVYDELLAGSQHSAARLEAMWREYVGRVSEDKATVPYLGSIGRLSKEIPAHASPAETARLQAIPEEVREQAFLTEPYTLSSVFKSRLGWHILMPISKLPAIDKKLDQVRASIRARLLKRKRDLARRELIETLRKRAKVDLHEDAVRLLPTSASRPVSRPDKPAGARAEHAASAKGGAVVQEVR